MFRNTIRVAAFTALAWICAAQVALAADTTGTTYDAQVRAARDDLVAGRVPEADKALDEAVTLSPTRFEAYLLRGMLKVKQGDFPAAEPAFVLAQRYAPEAKKKAVGELLAAVRKQLSKPTSRPAGGAAPATARPSDDDDAKTLLARKTVQLILADLAAAAKAGDADRVRDLATEARKTLAPFMADSNQHSIELVRQAGTVALILRDKELAVRSAKAVMALRPDYAKDDALLTLVARLDRLANDTGAGALGLKFVRIGPGAFMMGSPETEPGRGNDETQHQVTLTKPFSIGVHLVTRRQFAAFVKDARYQTDAEKEGWAYARTGEKWDKVNGASWKAPGFEQTDDHPVVEVSWNDAVAFCVWLSRKESKTYRLPTEAEWECASRAGTKTAYFWGDDPDAGQGFANCADLTLKDKLPNWTSATFDWRDGFVFTSPVGSFKPNPWGLYDMTGNVWEWCSDVYGDYPAGAATDPPGAGTEQNANALRVLRGGSWGGSPDDCRSALRLRGAPGSRDYSIGFRVVLDSR